MNTWKIDPTISVSAILACAAIISPILTALINNWHNRRMRKMELKQKNYNETILYKKRAIERYLQNTSKCILNLKEPQSDEYADSFGALIPYVPEEIRDEMIEVDELLHRVETRQAYEAFIVLIPRLTAILQTL